MTLIAPTLDTGSFAAAALNCRCALPSVVATSTTAGDDAGAPPGGWLAAAASCAAVNGPDQDTEVVLLPCQWRAVAAILTWARRGGAAAG